MDKAARGASSRLAGRHQAMDRDQQELPHVWKSRRILSELESHFLLGVGADAAGHPAKRSPDPCQYFSVPLTP